MKRFVKSLSRESLSLLAEASSVINSTLDLRTVLDNIAESAAKVMSAEAGSVLVHDKPRSKLVFVSATGERAHLILGQEFDAELGIAGRVASTGKAEIVSNVQADKSFYHGIDEISNFSTRALMAAPMLVDTEVIGVVEVLNRVDGEFSEGDLELLKVFANLAAFAARNAQTHERLNQQHRFLCEQVLKSERIIGDSGALREVRSLCDRVAPSMASVLLLGETGTGKELFAKYIHNNSPRAEKPFVAVNCGALAESLLESELFGHEKGAFTGAIAQQAGRFEMAEGGTIFLDEVAEMSPHTQVKLLRVLQERTFERVGGSATIACDVRVIAATHRDLKQRIAESKFREDLYYRLNVFPVRLPALRERIDDIARLVEYFTARAAQRTGLHPPHVSAEAIAVLTRYEWPGNVRELQNVMERAVLLCNRETILPADLPVEVSGSAGGETGGGAEHGTLRGIERALVVKALHDSGWNQTKAAGRLGISRDNLRYRVKKYAITRDG
ncbi:MAG: sigma 54-interacting transcriptional regulator [Phycisphaerales bacterium]|nr:sigma 54-interacting transcriptional regulator [Phycisphaerales bacterium]